ncbi:unnamed protein product [Penicillium salamii]|uniref:Uncharacterized protein n=1 Tax=Penicillium salamii TaxID=1612424 RepID=A0A9W4I6K5_9EURO|nr:unnamed protein product [Penicillium salamii]CAG8251870.1 unnamed protein product [Penicillium salamii]CAG8266246.1 unnamed protein product [Penicillium salamii]CAG8341394.1 unnamed protein product [Penicillium salamii]CAG8376913.1 unnamed protein product [Penicillium salamii]
MSTSEYYDIIIIGAGIAGINAAYRVQTCLPDLTYLILEGRNSCGGTWDLFRYPGVRLDSDIHTFGFAWHPYQGDETMLCGQTLLKYIQETATQFGITDHIRCNHRVTKACWSSAKNTWNLQVLTGQMDCHFHTKFLLFATGYFDHDSPLPSEIPGIANYKGVVVHPQFWPEKMDYSGQRMIVVGSGATAISLVPKVAQTAASVTMVQRSPNYILSIPSSGEASLVARMLPESVSHKLKRLGWLAVTLVGYYLCRKFPRAAKDYLVRLASQQLPDHIPSIPHFQPNYRVWNQRLLACPDGDFFCSLHSGRVNVETGSIDTCTPDGIQLNNGLHILADVIVTATGLKLQIGGGVVLEVDGSRCNVSEKLVWNGMMLQDVPNAFFALGYLTTASWTMGTDLTAMFACRSINRLRANQFSRVTPRCNQPGEPGPLSPIWDLNSSYMLAGQKQMPLAGSRGLWKPRRNYVLDYFQSQYGSFGNGLEWSKAV